jgi:hypothetical protein
VDRSGFPRFALSALAGDVDVLGGHPARPRRITSPDGDCGFAGRRAAFHQLTGLRNCEAVIKHCTRSGAHSDPIIICPALHSSP